MATQRVRYVGRHTGGIEVPTAAGYQFVKHHGVVEVDEKLARELIARGDFTRSEDEPKTKKKGED